MERTEFIFKIIDAARGIKLAIPRSTLIAQAALESAWGESGLAKNANALFGIKANDSWNGKTYNAKTAEVYDNSIISIKANFRAYDSWTESIKDHSNFLKSISRYKKVVECTDPYECAEELQNAGYATDPSYASKIKQIIVYYRLTQYDSNRFPKNEQDEDLPTPPMPEPPTAESEPDVIEILAYPGQTLNIRVRVLSNN